MTTSGWTLNGKTVFITGGGRGIGLETAKRLVAKGANVALLDLEQDVLDQAAAACGATDQVATFVADATDWDALATAADATVERFGAIDVVFANAGVAPVGLVATIDPAAWERTIEINLIGVWRTIRTCLPHVKRSKGYMLPVASVAALAHLPGMSPYCATKAGVEAFANSLRMEVKHHGVDVGCAYFSWIDTPLVRGADENPAGGKMRSRLKGPMGKTYPVSKAADATVKGMENRSRKVMCPGWIQALFAVRGAIQPLADIDAAKMAPEFERLIDDEIREHGVESATGLVGPGGRAAAAAGERTPAAQ